MALRYGSICSGIEAASVAWHPLGWMPSFFSEIDPFPRAVLAHRWPDVRCHGDFTTIEDGDYDAIDLLVGGTPCQSFSVAGLRGGLADQRGNLSLEYCRLAQRLRPRWLVWENVPGVLSIDGGRAFSSILGALGQFGYGWAYRVLDAQYCGVPQQRRRVILVGYSGDWRPAAKVLFERESLRLYHPPGRKTGAGVAAIPASSAGACGDDSQGNAGHLITSTGDIAHCLNAGAMGRQDFETETLRASQGGGDKPHVLIAPTLNARQPGMGVETAATLISRGSVVRRLTPRECERLQGFPDDYTLIPWRKRPAGQCPDGPRYKALGNSMAVPVMHWVGARIQAFEDGRL